MRENTGIKPIAIWKNPKRKFEGGETLVCIKEKNTGVVRSIGEKSRKKTDVRDLAEMMFGMHRTLLPTGFRRSAERSPVAYRGIIGLIVVS